MNALLCSPFFLRCMLTCMGSSWHRSASLLLCHERKGDNVSYLGGQSCGCPEPVNLQVTSLPRGGQGVIALEEPHLVQESECSRIPVLNSFN